VNDDSDGFVRPANTIVRKKNSKPRPRLFKRKQAHRDALKKLNVHKPARACRARDLKIMAELKDMFRETWSSLQDKAQEMHRFSSMQLRFARQYAINGRTNIAEAVRLAGYNIKNDYNYSTHGRQLLKLPGMEELVAAFEFEEKAKMKINVDDVVAWFHKIATAAMEAEDFTNANRSMESLAKYLGMFVERKEITHKTVHNRLELDAQIAEYQRILSEGRAEIDAKLTIN
jgi:hypothetical protein